MTHNVIRPLEPEPALHIHPRTSASSPCAGCNLPRRHSAPEYAGTMRHIARRHDCAIALLVRRLGHRKGGRVAEKMRRETGRASRGHLMTQTNVHPRAALSQGAIQRLQLLRNASGICGSRLLCWSRSPCGARRRGARKMGKGG